MKRIVSVLLVCLLLCGLAMPVAFAEDAIDVSGAVPLTLGVATKIKEDNFYSYTPASTGWVKFSVKSDNRFSFDVYDGELSHIVHTASFSSPIVKLTAGITYYLTIDYGVPGEVDVYGRNTITPSASAPPVLEADVIKMYTGFPSSTAPFPDSYAGWEFTVNGQDPVDMGFELSGLYIRIEDYTLSGSYQLQFTNYDGEDLGTLTIIFEDFTLPGMLENLLTGLQFNWANEDKTTGEWLKSIGNDILFAFASPVIALMIFFCGPMGWILLPIALQPFVQLPIDIGGFITSLFR